VLFFVREGLDPPFDLIETVGGRVKTLPYNAKLYLKKAFNG